MCNRCRWVNMKNPLYIQYHDKEWGVPLHDDQKLFELLILEGFQAGLSWETVLNKRENFRAAFEDFIPERVASFTDDKCEELRENPGIIRNKLKIYGAVKNAKAFLTIQQEFGSFDAYIWNFTDGKTVNESFELRTTSPLSDEISKDLKKRGMTFVGSTIIYSFLQACGILNAHEAGCDWNPAK